MILPTKTVTVAFNRTNFISVNFVINNKIPDQVITLHFIFY